MVFNVSLEDHLEREGCKIAQVINDCICYLINHGLNETVNIKYN